jgi:zinc and cadmium transporter
VFVLSLNKKILNKIIFFLVSVSVGVLLGDVFVHILPEVFEKNAGNEIAIPVAIFLGMLVFFVLEKFFRWHHAHTFEGGECVDCHTGDESQGKSQSKTYIGNMVIFGDGLHNLIDGIIITTSFMIDTHLGFVTTLAVLFHEIPQEISDFGVLLHAGYSRARAILLNFASALVSFFGIGIVLYLKDVDGFLLLANAFTAGCFIYIAGSDLVPELHRTTAIDKSIMQLIAIILGFALMVGMVYIEYHA